MRKLFSTIIMMGAFVLGMNAQTTYFVVNTDGTEEKFDVTTVDSIIFMDRSQMEIKADTIFDVEVRLPSDASSYSYVDVTLPVKKYYSMFGYPTALDCINAVYSNEVLFYFYSSTTNEIYSEDHSAGTATSGGCWFDAAGDVCSWGESAYLFIEPSVSSSKTAFKVGQYPGKLADGEEYTLMMGLQNGETYVAFRFHITIGEIVQEAFTYDIFFEQNETGYDLHKKEIDTTGICSTFGLTLDELAAAIDNYEIVLYPVDTEGNIDKSEELLDMDGYWFTTEGVPCLSSAETAAIKIEPAFDGFALNFSQAPYATTKGDIYTLKVALSNSDVDIILTFNVTIVEEGYVERGWSNDGKDNITVHADISADVYPIYTVDLNGEAIAADLGFATPEEVMEAVGAGTVTLSNLNADLTDSGKATANGSPTGAWYDADGNVCSWGSTAMVYAEPQGLSSSLSVTVGQYPGHCASGDVYTIRQALINGDKRHVMTYEIHFY